MKSRIKKRLFLAPHLDVGVISFAGTLLADKEKCTETLVATVFSRSNYTKEGLGDAIKVTPIRQAEEKAIMDSIKVDTRFLDFPECPLRGYTISDPLDYPKFVRPELDGDIVEEITGCLRGLLGDFDEVIIPLAIGELAHVDHRIVREAATMAQRSNPRVICRVYEDTPYISCEDRDRVGRLEGFRLEETAIDLKEKLNLMRGYKSQPIEAWEHLICQAAGEPPVERQWLISEANALESLRRFA